MVPKLGICEDKKFTKATAHRHHHCLAIFLLWSGGYMQLCDIHGILCLPFLCHHLTTFPKQSIIALEKEVTEGFAGIRHNGHDLIVQLRWWRTNVRRFSPKAALLPQPREMLLSQRKRKFSHLIKTMVTSPEEFHPLEEAHQSKLSLRPWANRVMSPLSIEVF